MTADDARDPHRRADRRPLQGAHAFAPAAWRTSTAEDQQLGRKVALKLLHRRFAEAPSSSSASAATRECRWAPAPERRQRLPRRVGRHLLHRDGVPPGSLKDAICQEAPLDPVRLDIDRLKAARFAHRKGIVHRDLKPHNVMIDDEDRVKVTDFGIARAGASDMTETGSIMGTAQYLSPEQAQGHAVSQSSDLYAIGVILFELLTGHVPFDAESAVTIALSTSPRRRRRRACSIRRCRRRWRRSCCGRWRRTRRASGRRRRVHPRARGRARRGAGERGAGPAHGDVRARRDPARSVRRGGAGGGRVRRRGRRAAARDAAALLRRPPRSPTPTSAAGRRGGRGCSPRSRWPRSCSASCC